MSEEQLQRAAARLLDASGLLWCHVPNGGQRNAIVGSKLKAQGTKRGVPDILIFEPCPPHVGVAIELKVGRKKPTPEQERWLDALARSGWAVHVARTIDEVIDIVRRHYPSRILP